MSKNFKLIGALRIEEGTSAWITRIDGSAPSGGTVEIPLTPGLYYITGDGSATDLLQHLMDETQAAHVDLDDGGQSKVQLEVDSDGIIQWYTTSGSVNWYWSDPASSGADESTDVMSWLKLDSHGEDNVTVSTVTKTGDRTHAYGLYPSLYVQSDLRRGKPRTAQFVPDSANAQTIHVATREEYLIRVRTVGYPRASGFNEYHDLKDFHEHAMSGRPFRVYPDTTVTTAYSTSEREGYETMTMVPAPFFPQPVTAGWYRNMDWEFEAHQYAE